jgi:hypothetical protein
MPAAGTIRKAVFAAIILIWGASIFYGARVLLQYETGEGKPGQPPSRWPAASSLQRSAGRFTLVMAAHPDCPCTRAGVKELEQLTAGLAGRLDAFVVFRKPEASHEDISSSLLWKTAAAIPGIQVRHDANGEEIERFQAWVSGQTMLYDREGRLVFSGGITNARGLEGYSRGEQEIIRIVTGRSVAGVATTAVFGCSLHDPDSEELSKEPSWKKR